LHPSAPEDWPAQMTTPSYGVPVNVHGRARRLAIALARPLDANAAASRLPEELLERLPRAPSKEAVELGAVQAYPYSGLRPRGFRREVNLYLVPTTGPPMAIGCLAPPGSADFMGQCERVASTLRLRQATPVAIAPAASYTRTLRRLVSRLASARSSHRRSLRRARTPRSQAAAANRLGRLRSRAPGSGPRDSAV
jgi:hypothetical protein